MSRPRSEVPTPGELEVLTILWERGACTAREVWTTLNDRRERHYTSVNSLLNAMAEKGLVERHSDRRAFLYEARVAQEETQGRMVQDLMGRVFGGSPSGLVLHMLDHCDPSPEEMDEIAEAIRQYRESRGKQ